MKNYRIVCRQQQWHLLIEGQECGLLQADERSYLVQIACKVASERGSTVHVFDNLDTLEAKLSFNNGVLAVDGTYRGDLDLSLLPKMP